MREREVTLVKGNNRVILQGWLHLNPANMVTQTVNGYHYAYLRAEMDTDSPAVGGRHLVVITGANLGKALLLLNEHHQPLKVQAVVMGYLVTYDGRSHVVALDLTLVPATVEVEAEPTSA